MQQSLQSDASLISDLVDVRRRRNMSQQALATKLGVTQSAIARFESGERNHSQATIRRYAMAVGACITHEVRPQEESLPLLEDLSSKTKWREVTSRESGWKVHVRV